MRFKPKSAAEIRGSRADKPLLPPGEYDFEITSAKDAISKAGNEMLALIVNVYDASGDAHTVWDYLTEASEYKLRHLAEACGLVADYEAGDLDPLDVQGKTGRCKIVISKDKNGEYPDKNGIYDYIVPLTIEKVERSVKKAQASSKDLDDEIPF